VKRLATREWCYLDIGEASGKITRGEGDALLAVARGAARDLRVGQDEVLQDGRYRLRAGQTVGILAVPSLRLEILPKIEGLDDRAVRRNLVRMIAEVGGFPVSAEETAELEHQEQDLLEILIALFADRLLAALRPGLVRTTSPRKTI